MDPSVKFIYIHMLRENAKVLKVIKEKHNRYRVYLEIPVDYTNSDGVPRVDIVPVEIEL